MGRLEDSDPFLRFNEKTIKDEGGCWFWQGNLTSGGYPAFKVNRQSVYVHRWAYEAFKGSIPEGWVLDHLCGNRSCVNPDHLEAVTVKENVNRRTKTHCFAGHPLAEDNLYMQSGVRTCRICHREREAKYRERSKLARKGKEVSEQEGSATRIFLLIASNTSEVDLLIQELEKLKQRGLIVDFLRPEAAS